MIHSICVATVALALTMPFAMPVSAQVMVGGAPMYANKDIGPFTVFAPMNAAFAALPAGTVDTLLKPENKPALTKVLTFYVVPGRLDAAALQKMVADHKGAAMLKTVEGESLTATMIAGVLTVTDSKGDMAHVTTPDVIQSNGVIHAVDRVLLPK